MTIGFLKRALLVLNLVALAVIGMAVWGFLGHKKTMQASWKTPVFQPEVKPIRATGMRTGAIGMPLGRFPEPKKAATTKQPEKAKPDIRTVLARLGKITNAIEVYPPYDDGVKPSITFKLNENKKTRVLALGEAIQMRDHPEFGSLVQLPYRYKFVGCRWDEKEQATYFRFDMNCDGKDIQEARWTGDLDKSKLFQNGHDPEDPSLTRMNKNGTFIYGNIDGELKRRANEKNKAKDPKITQPIENAPQPVPANPDTFAGTLGSERDGTWTPSDDGRRYLRDNYEKVLKDARTETYRDSNGRAAGVRIVKIRNGSVANEFGIRADDVIVSINGRNVSKRAAAIKIVRDEVNKGRNIIRVKLLRNGRSIEKQFDARDPDVRRAARKLK